MNIISEQDENDYNMAFQQQNVESPQGLKGVKNNGIQLNDETPDFKM